MLRPFNVVKASVRPRIDRRSLAAGAVGHLNAGDALQASMTLLSGSLPILGHDGIDDLHRGSCGPAAPLDRGAHAGHHNGGIALGAGWGAARGSARVAVWAKAARPAPEPRSDTEHNAAFLKDFTPASSIHDPLGAF
jgi:hypothetical protein